MTLNFSHTFIIAFKPKSSAWCKFLEDKSHLPGTLNTVIMPFTIQNKLYLLKKKKKTERKLLEGNNFA